MCVTGWVRAVIGRGVCLLAGGITCDKLLLVRLRRKASNGLI